MPRVSAPAERTRNLLLTGGTVVLICACVFAVKALDSLGGIRAPQVTQVRLDEVAVLTRLWFPENALGIGAQLVTKGSRSTLCARVHFSDADLEGFAARIPRPHQAGAKLVRNTTMDPRGPWWNPDDVRDYLSVSYTPREGEWANVMVSVESGTARAFIVWRD